ncbi:MAG: DUF262 domain-containing protein [Nitrospina sp.]|jgi:hypothetical protein|nr:DUF262 domain-containing protein [Nitrospina sp.]
MKINQLLYGVENLDMVMPEFQREYVWSLENAKQLMVSLFKNYPTGSLLFWEATGDDVPEIKNNAIAKEKIGLTKVILDGQQRITTLYLLIKGEIPPYYSEEDLINDPRHLYFNMKTQEFQYYTKSLMQDNPFWQRTIDCFDTAKVDDFDLIDKYMENHPQEDQKEITKTVLRNLNTLRSIEKIDYPLQFVPSSAKLDEAIDVFDRVNSKGTKLTDAELVLTHITGKWPLARRKMKKKIRDMKMENFEFHLDFLTRCMTVALTGSALYKKNSRLNYDKFTKQDYIDKWNSVSKALDYLIPILKQDALINSTSDISTTSLFVPIIAYLLKNNITLSEDRKYGFIYSMFLASIWGRYSGQTDQRIDKDAYLAMNSKDPIGDLVNEIKDQRGRIEIKPSDLEGRGAGHPLYRMLYIVTKHKKAIDWANGGSLSGTIGDYYSIQSHHVFPRSLLYDNGYNSENHIDKKKVNEIANRAFITRDTNFKLSNSVPGKYLGDIETKFPGALEKQFIPLDPLLWKIENYEKFLNKRRSLIANYMNSYLENLLISSSKVTDKTPDWNEIISKGENDYVEFKSSMRWDMEKKQVNKILEHVIAKTISAFLNTEGGRLFIGVNDDGLVTGIENDYKTLGKKQNRDGFLLSLTQVINNYIGKEFHEYITVRIETIDAKDICIVEISQSGIPIYLKNKDKHEFYIRASASSQPMGLKEANDYIHLHWNEN